MEHTDETLLSVVVLELGSAWPPWLAEYQKLAPNSVVIAQSSDESGPQFAQRIARKMAEIGASETVIHAGLLVSNGALDPVSISAREQICAALLRVMLAKQHGELVLAASASAREDVRYELFSLAGRLCDELRGTQVSVRVRFDTLRPASSAASSGVMKTVPPSSRSSEVASRRAGRASNGSG
jgi:hypothetical protein